MSRNGKNKVDAFAFNNIKRKQDEQCIRINTLKDTVDTLATKDDLKILLDDMRSNKQSGFKDAFNAGLAVAFIGVIIFFATLAAPIINNRLTFGHLDPNNIVLYSDLENLVTTEWMTENLENMVRNFLDELPNRISGIFSGELENGITPNTYQGDAPAAGFINFTHIYNPTEEFRRLVLLSSEIDSDDLECIAPDTPLGEDEDGYVIYFSTLDENPFSMSYQYGIGEIWFFGKINDNGRWHGFSILNHYDENGSLIALFETEFYDGKRIGDFKQFSADPNNRGYNFQIRTYVRDELGSFTYGETFLYQNIEHIYAHTEEERSTPIRFNDIIRYDIVQYFRGQIRDGVFHDITGKAILIQYDNGIIDRINIGNITHGSNLSDNRPVGDDCIEDTRVFIHVLPWYDEHGILHYYQRHIGPTSGQVATHIRTDENPSDFLPISIHIEPYLLNWRR